ncbi:type II toxin-antitoxin system VapC family toxin [Haloarchaeobius litoreus]|uniref:Type II toxin-antitoxin system VapC family toxin n=1 Tax=Haloarchaeobius litoreus TaxID=755306 RepID=A0ABD6DLE6_9EURY|nr:type II toxin-antitoxin system VapC family toxin [Haloarchaeobius litoreus]
MEVLFFDTSALVKRYYEEPGTELVDDLVEDDRRVTITSLAVIETISAFRRKYNRDQISESDTDDLLAAFFREALDDFVIVPMEESIQQFSFDLILEDDLRTLDSLQLAAALALDGEEADVVFVSADSDLVAVANDRGLQTVNPDG